MGLATWIGMLLGVIRGIILYVITDKFSYWINWIIYILIKIIPFLLLGGEIGAIMSLSWIIKTLITNSIVIYVAQRIRESFEYETIVTYILIISLLEGIFSKIFSIF